MKSSAEVKVSCEFLEIYCDELRDLFYTLDHKGDRKALEKDNRPKLDVGLTREKRVVVKGIVEKFVSGPEEMIKLFNDANGGRVVHATSMNKESSRSHSVFTIKTENYNKTTKKTDHGKLCIIDLAGSERVKKSEVVGTQFEEAVAINKSLSALGDVIKALSAPKRADGKEEFVNYRNNILTRVMQDSLGGTAKTLMFINASPSGWNADETRGTLEYGSRVKDIKNVVGKATDSAEVNDLKKEIEALKKQIK